MPLAIGACVGRVVRLLPNGFAVKFIEVQKPNELPRLIARKTRQSELIEAELAT
jgi:hypothetical protein